MKEANNVPQELCIKAAMKVFKKALLHCNIFVHQHHHHDLLRKKRFKINKGNNQVIFNEKQYKALLNRFY